MREIARIGSLWAVLDTCSDQAGRKSDAAASGRRGAIRRRLAHPGACLRRYACACPVANSFSITVQFPPRLQAPERRRVRLSSVLATVPDSKNKHAIVVPGDVVDHVVTGCPLPNRATLVERSAKTGLLGKRLDSGQQSMSDSVGCYRVILGDERVQALQIGKRARAIAQSHWSSMRGTGFSVSVPHEAIHSCTDSPSMVGAPASTSSSASSVWR